MQFLSEGSKTKRSEISGGKNSVVLYYPKLGPGEKPPRRGIWESLSLLALAGPLEAKGYDVHIIDGRTGENLVNAISRVADNLICVGISAMVGYQIYDGLKMTKTVRRNFKEIPIVWGGWHSSTMPEQRTTAFSLGFFIIVSWTSFLLAIF